MSLARSPGSDFSELVLIWAKNHGKHLSIFVVASIVLLGNLLVVKPEILSQASPPLDFKLMAEVPTATTDLATTVKAVSLYTPTLKEDYSVAAKKITEEVKLAVAQDRYLIKPNILGISRAYAKETAGRTNWYQIYIVKKGESLGAIASRFGVSSSSILASNNITDADIITPGQHLRIPEKNGTMHTVASGQSLIGIVRYYKGDLRQTIAINNLKSDQNRTIFVGQKIFIVGGIKPKPTYIASNDDSQASSGSSWSASQPRYSGGNHRFPYGYCTWWVASKRNIPWSGNANQWLGNARSMGYATGRTPRPGAIMVTNESWWGHVAYVEAVHGNSVTISEMNYAGWGKVNYRTLSAWYGQYIY